MRTPLLTPERRIFIAGHKGLVGSALMRAFQARCCDQLITRSRQELDLTRQDAVERFFAEECPEVVVIAAARVGGIAANDRLPADFIRDNLLIQTNLIDTAFRFGTKKLLFLGSSCIYPKEAPIPIAENALLSGPLEPTNQWYAVAKIAGIKMCQAYRRQFGFDAISVMPTNLYGPNDNYEPDSSHVMAALIRRFAEAVRSQTPEVMVWGSGRPRREFLHADDCADACLFLLENYSEEAPINVGAGSDLSIFELAVLIAEELGFSGDIRFDASKPDGVLRKLMNSQRLYGLGWRPHIELRAGIREVAQHYLMQIREME